MPVNIATTPQLTIGGLKNSVTSLTGSVSYLKAFIPVAAHNIIGNRVNYDPSYFKTHMLMKTPYKTFSKNVPKKHDLYVVYDWLKSAMEGIQKKYLKQLYLIVRDKNTKDVIEFYCFTIQFIKQDKSVVPAKPWEAVYESTAKIFHSINLLSELPMLDCANVTFALQVNLNEAAPRSYITPNFDRGTPFVDPEENETYSMGSLSTGSHKLKIHVKGDAFVVKEDVEAENEVRNVPVEGLSEESTASKSKITVLENRCLNKRNLEQERNAHISEDIDANTNDNFEEVTVKQPNKRSVRHKVNKLSQDLNIENIENDKRNSDDFLEAPKEKKRRLVIRDNVIKLPQNDSEDATKDNVVSGNYFKVPNVKKMEEGDDETNNFREASNKKKTKAVYDNANKLVQNSDVQNTQSSEIGSKNVIETLNQMKEDSGFDKANNLAQNKDCDIKNDMVPEVSNKKKMKVRGKTKKYSQNIDKEKEKDEIGSEDYFEVPRRKRRKVTNKSTDTKKKNPMGKGLTEKEIVMESDNRNIEDDYGQFCDNFIKDLIESESKIKGIDNTEENNNNNSEKLIAGDEMKFENIQCLCGITNAIKGVDLIDCDNCGNYEHCACVGYKSISDIPRPHICYPCHVLTGKKLSDVRMSIHRNQKERQMFAVLRLVSFYCFTVENTPSIILDQIEGSHIYGNNMMKFNFIYEEGGEYFCNIENIRKLLQGATFYKSAKTVVPSSPISIK